MDSRLEPILLTFEYMAGSYASIRGLEAVNRSLLAPYLAETPGRILEVGCGPAEFIREYFNPMQHTLFAIDFSENMIDEARDALYTAPAGTTHLVRALAGALPFPAASFDAVTCVNTLHNFPTWDHVRDALAEMARVLRPGGLLVVECRNRANSERRRITRLHDRTVLPQKAYLFKEFREVLESAGLESRRRIALYGARPDDTKRLPRGQRPRAVALNPDDRRFSASPRFAIIARKPAPSCEDA
jgi:ubiquinone/menaquinone biosynthesis C-methylase UbiE